MAPFSSYGQSTMYGVRLDDLRGGVNFYLSFEELLWPGDVDNVDC